MIFSFLPDGAALRATAASACRASETSGQREMGEGTGKFLASQLVGPITLCAYNIYRHIGIRTRMDVFIFCAYVYMYILTQRRERQREKGIETG